MINLKSLVRFFINEWLFSFSLLIFLVTEVLNLRVPLYSQSDFKVLFSLFTMLVILKGLTNTNFLEFIATKLERGKFVGHKLVLFTAIVSMFLTNDIAVLIVVPITLLMKIENVEKLVIFEIAAANAGSSLTPFGNPQNLFIYYHFNLEFWEFIKEIFIFTILIILLLLILSPKLGFENGRILKKYSKNAYIFLLFFIIFIISVLKILPLWVNTITFLYALMVNRKLLKIDYPLLLTFFFFFGFTDNLTHLIQIKLNSPKDVFLYSAFGSQIISNVPAALFFGDLTNNWKALLWGVNVGGFGTLVSSLANLIGYRLYCEKRKKREDFLIKFHIINFALFFIGILLFFLFKEPMFNCCTP